MVGHGFTDSTLEYSGYPGGVGANAPQYISGTDDPTFMNPGLHQMLGNPGGMAANGLNWAAVNSIDMSICFGNLLATDLQGALNAAGHNIVIRASDVSVTPVGQLHSMGVIRDGSSSIPKEIFHWLTLGIFKTAGIDSSPGAPVARNGAPNQNGHWFTFRS
jgi:hypothetical protein